MGLRLTGFRERERETTRKTRARLTLWCTPLPPEPGLELQAAPEPAPVDSDTDVMQQESELREGGFEKVDAALQTAQERDGIVVPLSSCGRRALRYLLDNAHRQSKDKHPAIFDARVFYELEEGSDKRYPYPTDEDSATDVKRGCPGFSGTFPARAGQKCATHNQMRKHTGMPPTFALTTMDSNLLGHALRAGSFIFIERLVRHDEVQDFWVERLECWAEEIDQLGHVPCLYVPRENWDHFCSLFKKLEEIMLGSVFEFKLSSVRVVVLHGPHPSPITWGRKNGFAEYCTSMLIFEAMLRNPLHVVKQFDILKGDREIKVQLAFDFLVSKNVDVADLKKERSSCLHLDLKFVQETWDHAEAAFTTIFGPLSVPPMEVAMVLLQIVPCENAAAAIGALAAMLRGGGAARSPSNMRCVVRFSNMLCAGVLSDLGEADVAVDIKTMQHMMETFLGARSPSSLFDLMTKLSVVIVKELCHESSRSRMFKIFEDVFEATTVQARADLAKNLSSAMVERLLEDEGRAQVV